MFNSVKLSKGQSFPINYECITGSILNNSSTSAYLIIENSVGQKFPIEIPPFTSVNFQNLAIRQIQVQSGSVEFIFTDEKDAKIDSFHLGNVYIKNSSLRAYLLNDIINANIKGTVNTQITNSLLKVTLSGSQVIKITNSTFDVNILNAVLKVTLSGTQSISIANSVLKVTFSGLQTLKITNSTFDVNITNAILKVTLSGIQSVSIANSVLKVTLSGSQTIKITNSTFDVNIINSVLKVTLSGTQTVSISNSVLKVTLSGLQTLKISNSTFDVNIVGTPTVNIGNSVLKVTLSGYQVIKVANSTFDVNITNSVLKVTFSGTQTVAISNSVLKVTFSGQQDVNITNSQLDMNIANVSVQVPILAPEQVVLASQNGSGYFSNPSYIYVQINVNPYSMVKLLQIYAHANVIYKPLLSVGNSQCQIPSEAGINNPACGYDALLHQWNSVWANISQYSHIYPTSASDLNWAGGLHVSINGTTTGSWVNASISHFVEITRTFNPPLILLNNGSTTTSYYITFEEANGQNQYSYWILSVLFSVAFGSASYSTYDSVTGSSTSAEGTGCFDEDTLFLVDRGGVKKILPIKDIEPGDKVWNGEEFVEVREKFDEGYQTVYYFDNVWITETQPICFPTDKKDNYVCLALKDLVPISALEKRENVHVYDLTVDKYLLKPIFAKFRYGDVVLKTQ